MTNYGTIIDNTIHPSPRVHVERRDGDEPEGRAFSGAQRGSREEGIAALPSNRRRASADRRRSLRGRYWLDAARRRDGETWWRVYEVRAYPPPPPRRWTRLAIKTALAQAGMLSQALAYLAQVDIATGYSAAEALQDCDYIEEGYPDAEKWDAILDGAANALGKTRAEIDAFLDAIPQEA